MAKSLSFLLFFFAFFFFFFTLSGSQSILSHPRGYDSFSFNYLRNQATCDYKVVIATSCISPAHTSDQISIVFGEAQGNQIYAPRLDRPFTQTFERCSIDTFNITGACAKDVCYLYLYRSGDDGWKPDNVTISGEGTTSVTFYFEDFIPKEKWYGFDLCPHDSSSFKQAMDIWLMIVSVASIIAALW